MAVSIMLYRHAATSFTPDRNSVIVLAGFPSLEAAAAILKEAGLVPREDVMLGTEWTAPNTASPTPITHACIVSEADPTVAALMVRSLTGSRS